MATAYDDYRRDKTSLDVWSVRGILDVITGADTTRDRSQSRYYGYYNEDTNNLANLAGDMWTEMERLLHRLGGQLPFRRVRFGAEDELEGSGISWFNIAVSTLPATIC